MAMADTRVFWLFGLVPGTGNNSIGHNLCRFEESLDVSSVKSLIPLIQK